MKSLSALLLAFALAGCAGAVLRDLEEDKAIVHGWGSNMSMVNAEAQRGCSIHGRDAIGSLSEFCVDGGVFTCDIKEYLYACKK